MVSNTYREAFAEILIILNNAPEEEKKLIPQQFLEFINNNASQEYKINFDKNTKIEDLNLKKETKGLLSVIYYSYLCPADEKQEYIKLLENNQKKYDKELHEKYSVDNIFQNNNTNNNINTNINLSADAKESEEQALVEYKESFFRKVINKIKSFFKINKNT